MVEVTRYFAPSWQKSISIFVTSPLTQMGTDTPSLDVSIWHSPVRAARAQRRRPQTEPWSRRSGVYHKFNAQQHGLRPHHKRPAVTARAPSRSRLDSQTTKEHKSFSYTRLFG